MQDTIMRLAPFSTRSIALTFALWMLVIVLMACQPLDNAPIAATVTLDDAAPTLSQTFSAQDLFGGTLSFDYPADWVVAGSLTSLDLRLYSSQTVADLATFDYPPAGQAAAVIFALSDEGAQLQLQTDTPTVEAVVNAFIDGALALTADTSVLSAPQVEGNRVLVRDTSNLGDTAILALDDDDGFIIMSFVFAEGQYEQFAGLLAAILASADYEPTPASTPATD